MNNCYLLWLLITFCWLTTQCSPLLVDQDKTYLSTKKSAEKSLYLANQCLAKGHTSKAKKQYQKIIKNHPLLPVSAKALYTLANIKEKEEHYQQAFDLYQKIVESFPLSLQAKQAIKKQFHLIDAGMQDKLHNKVFGISKLKAKFSVEKVTNMVLKVLQTNPYHNQAPRIYYQLADYLASKNTQSSLHQAIRYFRLIGEKYNQSPYAAKALLRIAKTYYQHSITGNQNLASLNQANKYIKAFISYYPNNSMIKDAQKLLQKILFKQQEKLLQIGNYYFQSKDSISATFYYKQIIKNKTNLPAVKQARKKLAILKQLAANS